MCCRPSGSHAARPRTGIADRIPHGAGPTQTNRCRANVPPAVAVPDANDLVQGVRSIASIWTHIAWPATGLPRLCPFGTDRDVRTIYFLYGTVTRAIVDDSLRADAADLQREGLSYDARGTLH